MRMFTNIVLVLAAGLLMVACPEQGKKRAEKDQVTDFSDVGDPTQKGFPAREGLATTQLSGPENSETFRNLCSEEGSKVIQIDRPIDGYRGETFDFRFKLVCKDASYPTVFFISGGPGQASSEKQRHYYPENMNIILTDIRGVGLNSHFWEKGGRDIHINSEVNAQDFLAIIKEIDLKNYVIHGVSYGTIPSLILASLAEREATHNLPLSVILEGPTAHPMDFRTKTEFKNVVFTAHEESTDKCLSCDLDNLLGQYSPSDLGNLLDELLGYGLEHKVLEEWLYERDPDELDELIGELRSLETYIGENGLRVYNAIACREFEKVGLRSGIYLGDGKLDSSTEGSCSDDVIEHQINLQLWPVEKIPLYFFVGTHDIATPPIYGERYFNEVLADKKNHICVEGGGHNSLQFDLESCSEELWNAFTNPGQGMTEALAACGSEIKVDEAAACSSAAGYEFPVFDHHQ